MAKNNSIDISHIGMLAAFATYNKSKPGKCIASVIPTVNKATINVINAPIPVTIRIMPMNFAMIFKKNITMFPIESKKV